MGVMTVFDEATAIRRVGEGQYEVRPDVRFALVAPGGTAPPAVNGGVLLATMLRAVLDTSPHPHPVATSAHFLRVPQLAPAQLDVVWLKHGGTAATARATLVQDARPVLDLTVTTGTLPDAAVAAGDPGPPSAQLLVRPGAAEQALGGDPVAGLAGGPDGLVGGMARAAGQGRADEPLTALAEPPVTGDRLAWTGERPKLPPFEECVSLGPWPGTVGPDGTAGYAAQVDLRLDPATVGWRHGRRPGCPRCGATSSCGSTATPTPTCSPWRWTGCRRSCSAWARPAGPRPSS